MKRVFFIFDDFLIFTFSGKQKNAKAQILWDISRISYRKVPKKYYQQTKKSKRICTEGCHWKSNVSNKIRTMTWTENTFFTEEPLQSKMLLSCFDKRTFEVQTVFWPKAIGLIWSSLILSDLVWSYATRAKQIKQNKLSGTQFINLH